MIPTKSDLLALGLERNLRAIKEEAEDKRHFTMTKDEIKSFVDNFDKDLAKNKKEFDKRFKSLKETEEKER